MVFGAASRRFVDPGALDARDGVVYVGCASIYLSPH